MTQPGVFSLISGNLEVWSVRCCTVCNYCFIVVHAYPVSAWHPKVAQQKPHLVFAHVFQGASPRPMSSDDMTQRAIINPSIPTPLLASLHCAPLHYTALLALLGRHKRLWPCVQSISGASVIWQPHPASIHLRIVLFFHRCPLYGEQAKKTG